MFFPLINHTSRLMKNSCQSKYTCMGNILLRMYSSQQHRNRERTFIMAKPDATNRGLIGEIIKRFESKGYKLVALKMIMAEEEILKEHYKNLVHKPFYGEVVKYMMMGPVVPMIWEGDNVIATARVMLGETDPCKSRPGTVRGDFGIFTGRNICHGSDSSQAAEREISLWFKAEDICEWTSCQEHIIYED